MPALWRIEPYNRTIQEEFVDFHERLLLTGIMAFNDKLFDYLTWYNLYRALHGLRLLSPTQVIGHYLNSNQCNTQYKNLYVMKFCFDCNALQSKLPLCALPNRHGAAFRAF